MLIKTQVTISFDPVKEYEELKSFMETNDMNEFRKDSSTELVMFTKTDFYNILPKQ